MKNAVSYRKYLLEDLKNPIEAVAYLNAAIEDGDRDLFLHALRDVIDAQAQITTIARQAKIHRVSLHKMLSKGGNPTTESLISLFRVLGIRLKLEKRGNSKDLKKAA